MDVWEFYEAYGDGDRDNLSTERRGVLAISDVRQEVGSGGFDSYFRYWGGDTAPAALAALPDTLGDEWASVLEEAMNLFGDVYPTHIGDREKVLDSTDLAEAFEGLDARWSALEEATDADDVLSGFLDVDEGDDLDDEDDGGGTRRPDED